MVASVAAVVVVSVAAIRIGIIVPTRTPDKEMILPEASASFPAVLGMGQLKQAVSAERDREHSQTVPAQQGEA